MTFESEGLLIGATVYSFEFFALQRSETDSPSLEFALSRVLLYKPLCIIQFTQFWIRPQTKGQK